MGSILDRLIDKGGVDEKGGNLRGNLKKVTEVTEVTALNIKGKNGNLSVTSDATERLPASFGVRSANDSAPAAPVPIVPPTPGRISKPIAHCGNRQWDYQHGCWHDEIEDSA